MSRQWEGRTRGGSFGYRFFIWLVRKLGLGTAYAFLALVVVYFIPFAPRQTRSVWVYSRGILHNSRLRSVLFLYRSYYVFGQSILDKIVSGMGMGDMYKYDFVNYERILDYVGNHRGCVVIGAHVGSWQMGAPFFETYGAKVNIVMYDNEYKAVKDVISDNTEKASFNIIPLADKDFSFLITITSALRDGELICFDGDRYMNEDRIYKTEFMGRQADFPQGPFVLAAKCKCPVVFYFAVRQKSRAYKFIFSYPEDYLLADEQQSAAVTMKAEEIFKAYIAALEEVLRECPEQWFNYYDFWKQYSA